MMVMTAHDLYVGHHATALCFGFGYLDMVNVITEMFSESIVCLVSDDD